MAIERVWTFWDTEEVTMWLTSLWVVYGAGLSEKLLDDFIRKHNVRDGVFSEVSHVCLGPQNIRPLKPVARETDGLIETVRKLGIAYVAYSLLGRGWLVNSCDP
ncbi:uncharacterized protein B0T15DRAFT_508901 [Chaetomium strumarium]|uniref:NADP-dependent oxidoreductase domain-containing protein n=1 Tax=Chaetomium strumarium TaxID=1170767 RepID=A0AAJ0M492_9PEZI|nr:hypothetical protein B0T15DRAFT_508901 [Chaetomium strumarium]